MSGTNFLRASIVAISLVCASVSAAAEEETPAASPATIRFGAQQLEMPQDRMNVNAAANAQREAYFGDLHVHTTYSFDAFAFGTLATPYDAYRYAKGEAINHSAGYKIQLRHPLDFYAVTDHAMFLGAVQAAADPQTWFGQLEQNRSLNNLNAPENMNQGSLAARGSAFRDFLNNTLTAVSDGSIEPDKVNNITKSAWADIIQAAETFNDPGRFTTFVAYEYTSSTNDRGNLHRNVIFRGADRLPSMPFSRFHSQDPEGLWNWMEGLRENGIETLAIPHNSNGSNGHMFGMLDYEGVPIDSDYAQLRMRNEPLVEITQVKGTSETHPMLSTEDEWADFEIMPYRVATQLNSEPSGSYVREALLNGLQLEEKGIHNPYRFGFIGASDTHNAASSPEEDNYFSKVGLMDGTAPFRGSVSLTPGQVESVSSSGRSSIKEIDGRKFATGGFETWGASGLTGVWADSNTRGAIYDAFRRRETFATSGPRIRVRLFGGYFDDAILDAENATAAAYEQGVPMGAEFLAVQSVSPSFLASALRDPDSAPLQRLQIIKGWVEAGEDHEQVYDVACSDGGTVDQQTHRCPDNGAKVSLEDCSISNNVGANELKTLWKDPDYKAGQRAFYYVRVLENPTCRWSTWDAIRAGQAPRPDLKKTIQERAWTSPIWITSAGK